MRHPLVSTLVLGLAIVLQPILVDAAPIVDQSFLPNGSGDFNYSQNCQGPCISGQGFTVGLAGTLTSGEIYIGGATGTVNAGLYDLSGTLVEASSTVLSFAAAGFYSFAFSTPVTVGQTLQLLLTLGAGSTLSLSGEASNQYAGGAPNLGGSTLINREVYFRTFVDAQTTTPVPEPASMLLLGTGLAGLAVRRYRRSRS